MMQLSQTFKILDKQKKAITSEVFKLKQEDKILIQNINGLDLLKYEFSMDDGKTFFNAIVNKINLVSWDDKTKIEVCEFKIEGLTNFRITLKEDTQEDVSVIAKVFKSV